ncbi:MAG: glycosyltransferase [Gammaproteobacteria bacterium]|nr:glycosyltransferase [Gammaproteobacteria bacterium]
MQYLMVLPVQFYPLSGSAFAVESAFAEHLEKLLDSLRPEVTELAIAAPYMSDTEYRARQGYLRELDSALVGIRYVPLDPGDSGRIRYWLRDLPRNLRILRGEVRRADVVHAGPSPIYLPREILAILIAVMTGRSTVFVVDIDWRRSAWMSRHTRRVSFKSYQLSKWIYDPCFSAQVRFASRFCSLTLLKSAQLVADYGCGRPSVRNFLDASHSDAHILTDGGLAQRLQRIQDRSRPLRLVYFGRFVPYKGIPRMLEVMAILARTTDRLITFDLIGTGEQTIEIRELCDKLQLNDRVAICKPIPFGPVLFAKLQEYDLLLATPLSADTPRSALDAMAVGLPVLAYGTDYYADLQRQSHAVVTVPWLSESVMAQEILALDADRARLADLSLAAVEFARANTQEKWLLARTKWTRDLCFPGIPPV